MNRKELKAAHAALEELERMEDALTSLTNCKWDQYINPADADDGGTCTFPNNIVVTHDELREWVVALTAKRREAYETALAAPGGDA